MSKLKFAVTLGLFVFLTPALAQSLAEKEKYASEEKAMAGRLKSTAEQCKKEIKVRFDWSSFSREDLLEKRRGPSGWCEEAFAALSDICWGSEAGLKAVQDSVNSVTCRQATPRALSLKNGELVFDIDFDAPNNFDAVRTFLKNNL